MAPADLARLFRDVFKELEECSPREAFERGELHGRNQLRLRVLNLLETYLPKVERDIYGLPSATTLLLQQIHDDIKAERWPDWIQP